MQIASSDQGRKPGLYYAATDEGQQLPIVDVTNPAFAIEVTADDLEHRLQDHMREVERRSKVPAFVQNIVLGFMMKRSRLMRAITGAEGGFLGGMDTYILKLGPGNMYPPYASGIDRQISASLPGLSVRLRLQNVSHLLADGMRPMLAASPAKPLHLLNVGGGPAIDSLNALLILHTSNAGSLASRPIFIHILDLDEAGPHFGARALQVLQAQGAPLHGLDVQLEHTRYDWSDPSMLKELLGTVGDAIVAASSEGALFEYGSEEIITGNLKTLQAATPPTAIMVGSVTRADTTGRLLNGASRAALQMRGIDGFTRLAESAGWSVAERLDRPSGHDVCLRKA